MPFCGAAPSSSRAGPFDGASVRYETAWLKRVPRKVGAPSLRLSTSPILVWPLSTARARRPNHETGLPPNIVHETAVPQAARNTPIERRPAPRNANANFARKKPSHPATQIGKPGTGGKNFGAIP